MRDLYLKLYFKGIRMGTLLLDEDGQDMVEYALVMGLVAMGSVAAMKTFAASIATGLGSIGTHLIAYTS